MADVDGVNSQKLTYCIVDRYHGVVAEIQPFKLRTTHQKGRHLGETIVTSIQKDQVGERARGQNKVCNSVIGDGERAEPAKHTNSWIDGVDVVPLQIKFLKLHKVTNLARNSISVILLPDRFNEVSSERLSTFGWM